jgi:hypothetical protein
MRSVMLAGLVVLAVLAPHSAAACPEIGFADTLGEALSGLDGTHVSVSTPIVIPSAGATTDGWAYGVSVGWGLGDRQIGGLFPGTSVRRLLLHVRRLPSPSGPDPAARVETTSEPGPRRESPTHVGLTYGWFEHVPSLFDAGLDLGVAGSSTSQLGPFVQVTGGMAGLGLRLSGGIELGRSARATGAAELVVDVIVLARTLAGS